MNRWQRSYYRRRILELRTMIPGAERINVEWCAFPRHAIAQEGWRISVHLEARHVVANEGFLTGWARWTHGYSLAGGVKLGKALRDAREQAEKLRDGMSCPECGAVRDPGTLAEALEATA